VLEGRGFVRSNLVVIINEGKHELSLSTLTCLLSPGLYTLLGR